MVFDGRGCYERKEMEEKGNWVGMVKDKLVTGIEGEVQEMG